MVLKLLANCLSLITGPAMYGVKNHSFPQGPAYTLSKRIETVVPGNAS